jgi:hypothetical protein
MLLVPVIEKLVFVHMFLIIVFFYFQAEEVAVAKNLLAMAVGIKQKKVVDDIVKKVGDYTCLIHDAAWIFILVLNLTAVSSVTVKLVLENEPYIYHCFVLSFL